MYPQKRIIILGQQNIPWENFPCSALQPTKQTIVLLICIVKSCSTESFFHPWLLSRSVRKEKQDKFNNWPMKRNPQFLSNPHETWWKCSPPVMIVFIKFHGERPKFVDFLLMPNFWTCPIFYSSDLRIPQRKNDT